MSKNTIPNIWIAQEKTLHLYKVVAAIMGLLAFMLTVVLIVAHFRNPIVAVAKAHDVEFYPTERKRAPLDKADVELFTKQFLASLYVWGEFNNDKIIRAITPFTQDGLAAKVIGGQSQKYLKELPGKHLAQSIAFVQVSVLEDRVVCKFDRVLKIEGIPLVIPTEVTLSMIEGEATSFNPMGIYIGGIKENENVK